MHARPCTWNGQSQLEQMGRPRDVITYDPIGFVFPISDPGFHRTSIAEEMEEVPATEVEVVAEDEPAGPSRAGDES